MGIGLMNKMRIGGTILFYILVCSPLFAQNITLIDSLRKTLDKQTPAKQFDVLCTIGFEYRISLQDSTFLYCNRAFDLGKKIKIKTGLAKPLNFIGLAYTNKGDYKKALDYYYQSIEVSSEQNDSLQLAHAYNNLGRAFYDLGDLARAYENFNLSRTLFETIHDNPGLAYVYRSLANVYRSQGNDSEALEMSSRALELRKQIGDKRTLASAYMELGLLYQGIKDYTTSLQKLKQADSVSGQVKDKLTKAEIKLGIAENLFELHQPDSAFQIALQVLQLIKNGKNYKLFLRSSMLSARYYILKNNQDKAISILSEIQSDTSGFGLASYQRDAAFRLLSIYKKRNDKVNIEKFTNRYEFLDQKLENTDLKREVDQLKFKVELEKKERENKVLKITQEQNTILISKQRTQNLLLLLIAMFIGLLAFLSWLYSRKKKRDNFKLELQNKEILRQDKEITLQLENLSAANDELSTLNHEKNILMSIVAHDLKSPINRIFALARILEMEGNLNENQLNYLRLIKDTTNSGNSLITDLLDVTSLEENQFEPTLSLVNIQELIQSKIDVLSISAEAKKIQIVVENEVNIPITTDTDYISRIVDNLVSNALKFSASGTQVLVKLFLSDSFLVISVKDQGPGFSEGDKKNLYLKFKKLTARPTAGESSNGLGLAIVKILVDRLKGEINLITEPGKGSEFIVKLMVQ